MKKERLPRGLFRRGNSLGVRFALNGRIERRMLGPVSIGFAVEQRGIFLRQVREGCYQGRQRRVKETVHTVAHLWDAYLRAYRLRSGKDTGRLEIAWTHLKRMFEKMPAEEVSTDAIARYIESRRGQGMSAGTINRETAALKAAFRHGARVTPPMVERVPAFPVRLRENAPRAGFVTEQQYQVLASNAKQLWLRSLLAVGYSFGLRKSEMLNLRVGQVDLLDGWLVLRENETKNGEGRRIKLTKETLELLRACCQAKGEQDFVFTREAGGRIADLRDEWYSLCVASNLGRWVPAKRKNGEAFLTYRGLNLHDLRRAAIRRMVRNGVSETVAMRVSGHKTASVFRRYDIVDERDLERASRLIEAGRQASETAAQTDTKTDTSVDRVS